MSDNSKINWTDASWNPLVGCSKVSEGCRNCYAMTMAARIANAAQERRRQCHFSDGRDVTQTQEAYMNVVTWQKGGRNRENLDDVALPIWNNRVVLLGDDAIKLPLRWEKPRRICVNSMADLFHADVPFEFIDKVFAVMGLSRRHTYQVLTKRPDRMAEYVKSRSRSIDYWETAARSLGYTFKFQGVDGNTYSTCPYPLPNVLLGTSTEDQKTADDRLHHVADLYDIGWSTFLSIEPMIGPVNLSDACYAGLRLPMTEGLGLSWVIVGGESGPNARPMLPEWAQRVRDDCKANAVPFFFKQWGEWAPGYAAANDYQWNRTTRVAWWFNDEWTYGEQTPKQMEEGHRDDEPDVNRIGRRAAGRWLDGETHDEYPVART